MNKLAFKKIDAFASNTSSGNPAAVVFLQSMDEIDDDKKLRVAKELKGFVSEVGYVAPSVNSDFSLCYYSSEREVAFCGHATVAIMYDLICNNEELQSKPLISIETRTDKLQVENRFLSEDSVYISAPPPVYSDCSVSETEIATALKCQKESIDSGRPVRIVNGGLRTLIVPISDLQTTLDITPDLNELEQFCYSIGVDIILIYSVETSNQDCQYRTRVFAPTFGYLEDPATGSGNSAFGYYLLSLNLWNGTSLKLEQNGFLESPNFVRLFTKEDEQGVRRVWFGGGARVKIAGEYFLE